MHLNYASSEYFFNFSLLLACFLRTCECTELSGVSQCVVSSPRQSWSWWRPTVAQCTLSPDHWCPDLLHPRDTNGISGQNCRPDQWCRDLQPRAGVLALINSASTWIKSKKTNEKSNVIFFYGFLPRIDRRRRHSLPSVGLLYPKIELLLLMLCWWSCCHVSTCQP